MSEVKPVSKVVSHLEALAADADASDADLIAAFRNEVPLVLDFVRKSAAVAECAHEMLTNAYSTEDAEGIRIQSEDAVKLQWALREVGVGDDPGESGYSV